LDITAFIRELLFGYDCVIVPGFGGFIGNRIPARIDERTWTFYPPVKQISFNRNLNYNDGLLIGKISQACNISYVDARSMVDDFVSNIRIRMVRGETVLFDHIGSFCINHESNLQFEPDMNTNYDLDSYGLESFQREPREGYDVRKRLFRRFDKDPERRTSLRKILLRAAVVIPILAILVLVPLKTNIFKTKVETTTMSPLTKAELENNKIIVDKDLAGELAAEEEITGSDEADPGTGPPAVPSSFPEAPLQQSTGNILVITGSFRSENNAASQAGELNSEGYSAEIIEAQNGFYRVSALRCNDMDAAEAEKDRLIKKYPGTWISRR